MALETFHLFQILPVEIRVQVWELAMPNPRIIKIEYPPVPSDKGLSLRSSCPPPPLLAVNIESRAEFLKHYSLLRLNPSGSPGQDERIPIDFRRDTLFINFFVGDHPLDMDGWMGALQDNPVEREKIRILAFRFHTRPSRGVTQVYWPENYMCYQWLREFPRLKTWIVVLGEDPDAARREHVKFVSQDTDRVRSVVRSVRKEVEIARTRYFDAMWAAPKVKAFTLTRGALKYKKLLHQTCWETLSPVHSRGCICDAGN